MKRVFINRPGHVIGIPEYVKYGSGLKSRSHENGPKVIKTELEKQIKRQSNQKVFMEGEDGRYPLEKIL